MPKFTGRLVFPQTTTAPSSPVGGEVYYDSTIGFYGYLGGVGWVLMVDNPVVRTSLPSSPVDGQVIFYDPTLGGGLGILWNLRYNSGSASAYKWEFVGGSPLSHDIATVEAVNGTNLDAATIGPKVIPPLAGIYELTYGCNVYSTAAEQNINTRVFRMSDTTMMSGLDVALNTSNRALQLSRQAQITVLAGAVEYRMRYTGISINVRERFLRLLPVRVG